MKGVYGNGFIGSTIKIKVLRHLATIDSELTNGLSFAGYILTKYSIKYEYLEDSKPSESIDGVHVDNAE